MKRWKVDAGNSSSGPVGFVVYDVLAETREEALVKLRDTYALPESLEGYGENDDEQERGRGERTKVIVYFNAAALTVDDIEEDDDEEDGEESE